MSKPKTNFKRLVSNLPYNPSLINQVSFYAKRLKQETSVRRMGFAFIALTFLVQIFAVVAPPTATSASDPNNDLISGGFSSQSQAVLNCLDGGKDFGTILAHYNISCDNVAAAKTVSLRSTDYGGQLYSMGRLAYGKAGEYGVAINGRTYYMRLLHSWDSGPYSTYRALQGTSKTGTAFFILYDCGNLVIIGVPPVKPPEPVKTAVCSFLLADHESTEVLKKGTSVTVRGQVTGSYVPNGAPVDFSYDYINTDTGKAMTVPVVHRGVPFNSGLANDTTNVTFTPPDAGHYQFRLGATWDGGKLIAGSLQGKCLRNITVEKPVTDVCKDIPGTQTNPEDCKPCKDSDKPEDCLRLYKTASNNTQNIPDANGTTAHPGDIITYKLNVQNTGKATVKNYKFQENISDILDYADVTDLHGGTKDGENNVTWPRVEIKAGETATKMITVKVKDPIPNTPVSVSNPGKFDLTMTNVFGNTKVEIHVQCAGSKCVETVNNTLPNTGPGENLVIGFVIMSVVGYFFARSRLLGKELNLVRQEAATGA